MDLFIYSVKLLHFCILIKKNSNMKILFSILLFSVLIFASCQKEPCRFGHIEIWNTGSELVTIYSIASQPVLLPGETIMQDVEFCEGFDENGYECEGNQVQTAVTYKFTDGEMKSAGVMVQRCQTSTVKIFN